MTVSVKGAELFYSTRGDGPACLVLSSIGTKPYERQMPAQLSERLKLVFVDLRGSGRSTGDPADLTFDQLADDLEAIRVDLGAPRIAVLGHSILGALAIEYARRCPATVSHVIAVGTPPSGDMARLQAKSAAFFEEDASEERKQILRDNLAKLPPGTPPGQAMLAQTPMRFFDARFDVAPLFAEAELKPQFFAHLLGTLAPAWDITAGSSSLRVPLLIALGRYDYTVPHVLWDGIAPTLPGATVEIFERSGHQPFFEEPERFAAAVTDWMSSQRRGSAAGPAQILEPSFSGRAPGNKLERPMTTRRAACSCGQLHLTVEGEPVRISMCHCLACQRRTGSAFGVQARFPRDKVSIEGRSTQYVRTGDSGNPITSHFCPECGSTVYYGLDQAPDVIAVPVGAFADPAFPAPKVSVYESRRHAWVGMPAEVEHLD